MVQFDEVAFKTLKKGLLLTCVLLIVIPFACCKKEDLIDSRERIVEEGTPWYESSIQTYGDVYDGDIDTSRPILLEPNRKVYFEYYDKVNETPCEKLYYYDDSDKEQIINLNSYGNFVCCDSTPDGLYIVVKNFQNEYFVEFFDSKTNTLSEAFTIDSLEISGKEVFVKDIIVSDSIHILYTYELNNEVYSGIVKTAKNGVKIYQYTSPVHIQKISLCDDGKLVIFTDTEINESNSKDISLLSANGELLTHEKIDKEYIAKYWSSIVLDNGYAYKQGMDMKLYQYNFNTNEEKVILDYNNCDANMDILTFSSIYYCDDENIIFNKSVFYSDELNVTNQTIELKKSINPYIGRTILYAAPSNTISYLQSENISQFNKNNKDCVIYVTMEYSIYSDYFETSDEYQISVNLGYDKRIALLSKLMQDISAGDGPDILLDFSDQSIINSSDYLVDMGNIFQELDREDYFGNVINALNSNENIYYMPLGISVRGIYAKDNVNYSASQGITYDGYQDFVDNCCNGMDPIKNDYDRNDYINIAFQMNYNSFHTKDQHLTLDNDEFLNMCIFAKNLPETGYHNYGSKIGCINLNMFCDDLLSMRIQEEGYSLYGFPSLDGKGPILIPEETVSITTCCYAKEYARDLVLNGLSYEVQIKSKTNPVNIKAFDYVANCSLAFVNEYINSEQGIKNYYSENIISTYKTYLESADDCAQSDNYAIGIINEELQPYFIGQKDINSVIPIIENRTNILIDEQLG